MVASVPVAIVVAGAHDVAGLHVDRADAPGDRRADGVEAQLDLQVFDLRLVAQDRGVGGGHLRPGVLEIDLGAGVARDELLEAGDVAIGLLEHRPVAHEAGFRLLDLRLDLAAVEAGEQLALLHDGPIGNGDLLNLRVDARFQRHDRHRLDRADRVMDHGNFAAAGLVENHEDRRPVGAGSAAAAATLAALRRLAGGRPCWRAGGLRGPRLAGGGRIVGGQDAGERAQIDRAPQRPFRRRRE